MAVVVQELVDADSAGVLFSRNPLDGSDELVIEAAPESLGLKRRLFADLAYTCGPKAILASNDNMAIGAAAAVRLSGRSPDKLRPRRAWSSSPSAYQAPQIRR